MLESALRGRFHYKRHQDSLVKTDLYRRVCEQMSEALMNFLWGTLCLGAGVLIFLNLDDLVRIDQYSGVRLRDWYREKLGKSELNRELWPAGTPAGYRNSKIGLGIAGVIMVLIGAAFVGLSYLESFH